MIEGSGNVFRDLGDLNADLNQAKAILAALGRFTLDQPMKMLAALDGDPQVAVNVDLRLDGRAAAGN